MFIKNHARQVLSCDFLTQYTAFFAAASMPGDHRRRLDDDQRRVPLGVLEKATQNSRSMGFSLGCFMVRE
jgi:hypothetical protein